LYEEAGDETVPARLPPVPLVVALAAEVLAELPALLVARTR
jgi:hypothetical protein